MPPVVLQKKLCMLGAFAVGKTSLVARYVHSIFSEKYLTTVGVKIDKKVVKLGERDVTLLLWDLYGEDELQRMQASYLRGSAGLLIVADGTRAVTVDRAREIRDRALGMVGPIPHLLVLNKSDLQAQWEVGRDRIEALGREGWQIQLASAKSGDGVEPAFLTLARCMVGDAP